MSDIAQFLLLSGANPDVTFSDGRTAVHAAAERGDLALLRALINAGSILDARDSSGLTPLHICCMNAHAEAIFLLAVEGADMTARTNENQTPKDLIASSLGSHAQRTASLARLEDAGAQPLYYQFAVFVALLLPVYLYISCIFFCIFP